MRTRIERAEYPYNGEALSNQADRRESSLVVIKVWFGTGSFEICKYFAGTRPDCDDTIEKREIDLTKFEDVTREVEQYRWLRSERAESAFQDDLNSGRAALILGTSDF